ncbi:MAG: type II secretion system F family protein [Nanoarchaeota archaeon]
MGLIEKLEKMGMPFFKELGKDMLGFNKDKLRTTLVLLPLPFILALILFLLKTQSTTIVAVFAIALVAVLMPYLAYGFLEFKEITQAEEGYPGFLRDLAQAISSGMTIPQALQTTAHARYGVLTKYVQKLNNWVSLGIPFPDAWKKFTGALEKSNMIKRINGIVLEAFVSGGQMGAVLSSLATDVILLKRIEEDKKSAAQQHVIVMYIIFFIFLGIIAGLYKILIPILYIQKIGAFSGISLRPGEELSIDYFKNLFFAMALIQSACIGLISGQISEEKLIAGLKHVVVMIAIAIFTFFTIIYPASLALEVHVFPETPGIGQNIAVSGSLQMESTAASGATVEILGPSREIQQLVADSQGEFTTLFKAPLQPGAYSVVITANYRGETDSKTVWVTVGG